MKKILFSLCVVSALLSMVGCEKPTYTPEPADPTITLEPTALSLLIGQTDTLVATITPATEKLTIKIWESNNTKVAKVDTNGVVTARAAGEAIITLTTNIGSAQCAVTVVEGQLIISSEALECNVFETKQLTVTTPEHKANAKVTWKSSNSAVASVDTKGNVTALSAGNAVISASVSGCSKAQCTVSVKEVPLTLPRKHLIEHFTSDQCMYCPAGMYGIVDYLETATTPTIWVSHHAGFGTDQYTIDESQDLVNALGVNGAPSMALNRTKQEVGEVFHPGYLPDITIADATVTAMSVKIAHTYDASSRKMNVTVSGESSFATDAEFLLSVLVKENRLVGKQADYYYALGQNSWKEFMHTRVVRDMLTKATGDTIELVNQAYSKTWSYTIPEKWVAENCCVVAYITPVGKKPVINAEQVVLVEGTTGGEEYLPYGITESKGPVKDITFHAVEVSRIEEENLLEVMLVSNTKVSTFLYGNAQPVVTIYVHTDATTLSAGTYPVKEDGSKGCIQAGYRIDERTSFGGSLLVYAVSDYLAMGQIAPAHIWRMQGGEMVVDEQGNINLNIKTCSGTTVTGTYTAGGASLLPKLNKTTEWKQYIDLNKGLKK